MESSTIASRPDGTAARTHALVAVFFLIWSLVILSGAWRNPRRLIPGDVGDPILNAGILHWNATVLPLTGTWWNFPSFAPLEGVTAYTEHLLALSVFASPVIAITGDPILAYNSVVLLSFVLSGIAMYALVFWLSRSVQAGFIAGIAFAFCPFRAVHLSHVQMLWTFGMPLALLGLHQFLAAGRARALVVFAAGWMLTVWGNAYFMVFFSIYVACWLGWFGSTRQHARRTGVICAVGALTLLPMLPLLLAYSAIQDAHGLVRQLVEIRSFSADLAGLFRASPHAAVASALTTGDTTETALFPGWLVLLLSAGGLLLALRQYGSVPRRRMVLSKLAFAAGIVFLGAAAFAAFRGPVRTTLLGVTISLSRIHKPLSLALLSMLIAAATTPAMRAAFAARDALIFHAAAALLMLLLCLGPDPTLNGAPVLYGTPYRWLVEIPAMQALRVPARSWMLATLSLATIAGLVVASLSSRLSRRTARVLSAGIAVWLLVEGWLNVPTVTAPNWRAVAPEAGAMVLELPAGVVDTDVAAQLRAVAGGYRTVNGYSGYFPGHYPALLDGLRNKDERVLAALRRRQPVYVSVAQEDRPNADWIRSLQPAPRLVTGSSGRQFYRLDALPQPVVPPLVARAPLMGVQATCNQDWLHLVSDADLDTRWHCGPQVDTQTVTFDLQRIGGLAGIAHTLGPYRYDFPRHLTIEVSKDQDTWREVWSDGTAALAVDAGLTDPRRLEVTIRFPPTEGRYVRLTQSGRDPQYYWSIAEIAALTVG